MSELKTIEIKSLSATLSDYRMIIDDLVGKILEKKDNKLKFVGDQFDTLYLKYHLFSSGVKNFVPGSPNDLDLNIQNKLAEILTEDILSYRRFYWHLFFFLMPQSNVL